MTLAQKTIQKLSAFIAGSIVFAILWLTMNPYTLILDLLDERTVVTALGTIIAVLVADAVIGYVAPLRQGQSKKFNHTREEPGTVCMCPTCGIVTPVKMKEWNSQNDRNFYLACPRCGKPLGPQMPVPVQPLPPPIQQVPPPPPAPVAPVEAAHALGVPEKAPAAPEPKKPRLELRPDGTIIVYPGA